jgi:hypothetical protein
MAWLSGIIPEWVGLSGIAHHVWDPDTSPPKKGGRFWVLKPTSVHKWKALLAGPSATEEEEVATACWWGWCILVFMYKMVTASIQKPGTAYQLWRKTQWRLDKMYTNFTILLQTLAAHTSTWWFRWFRCFLTLYIFFLFIGGFLRRFLVPETIHTLTLWGLDLILLASQDCDAWPWCSLAGRNELLVPLFTLMRILKDDDDGHF